MLIKHLIWRLLLAAATIGILIISLRSREAVPVTATIVAAMALLGLIFLTNRENLRTILNAIAWTFAGAFVGVTMTPSPASERMILHLLFIGLLSGWALGAVFTLLHRKHVRYPIIDPALAAVYRFLQRPRAHGGRRITGHTESVGARTSGQDETGSGGTHMLKRILLSYLGAFVVPICLLSLTISGTMDGHSLMYSAVLGLPIGATVALWYSDFRRHYRPIAAFVRSIVGLLVFVLTVLVVGEIKVSPFWINHGWVLIPACGPLVAAVISGLIFTTRVKPKT